MKKRSYQLTTASLLLLGWSVSSVALAEHGDRSATPSPTVRVERETETPEAEAQETSTHQSGDDDAAKTRDQKGSSGKLKACQARATAVNNIMGRIVDRGTKQIAVFDKIATRTEAVYTKSGKTVANYSTLTAKLAADKAKAQSDLAAMKAQQPLKCDSSNPKAALVTFKTALKLEISDLKAYKTDVKNLIVAVRKAADTSTPSPSVSASPTASPKTTTGGAQ